MKVKIADIVVKERIRKDLGDIESLKHSIQKHGLLSPIIVTPKNELLAGYRRLTVAKMLGWQEIEAIVYSPRDRVDELEIEIEENMTRKDFTPEEVMKAIEKKQMLLEKNPFVRFWNWLKNLWKKIFGKETKTA
ncbi:MAG: ParB N-terminal domain-containing protein [Brevinematales bacterium]|nr:ParB N-terminal domain-containing protein [Brevinematales bacterium]